MEIAPSLPQVFVFDCLEGGVQFLKGEGEGPLGIHLLLPDGVDGVLNQHLVIQDHEMDIQDKRMAAHLWIENLLFDLHQLFPGFLNSPEKSFHLIIHLFRLNPFLWGPNLGPFDHKGFSRNDPGRGPDALDKFIDLFLNGHSYSSPNLFSINRPKVCRAWTESLPSTFRVIFVPLEAASMRMPMIDFPLTSRLSFSIVTSEANLLAVLKSRAAARA